MAKTMGGDLVLQLLQEFRESQVDYRQFKGEMLGFKQNMELRMDLMHQTGVETLGYLKHIVKMMQTMKDELAGTRHRVAQHDELLGSHEQRLTSLEKK